MILQNYFTWIRKLFIFCLFSVTAFLNFRNIVVIDKTQTISSIIGDEKCEETSPTVYVVFPHSNQFMDAIVLLDFFYKKGIYPNPVIAESSRNNIILKICSFLTGSISAERLDDHRYKGTCDIEIEVTKDNIICSHNIQNADSFMAVLDLDGRKYFFKNKQNQECFNSTNETTPISLKKEKYYLIEKYNNEAFKKKSKKVLESGGSIIIFPEGGSHDNDQLQEFKPGFASIIEQFFQDKWFRKASVVPILLNYECAYAYPINVNIVIGARIPFESPVKADQIMEKVRSACENLFTENSQYDIIHPFEIPNKVCAFSQKSQDGEKGTSKSRIKPSVMKLTFLGKLLNLGTIFVWPFTSLISRCFWKSIRDPLKKAAENSPMKLCGCDRIASIRMLTAVKYGGLFFVVFIKVCIIFWTHRWTKVFFFSVLIMLNMAIVRGLLIPKYFSYNEEAVVDTS
ncbi:hypothetical protein MDAP_002824 [Mitosporidium daphniae]|uniref:Phospholipid/glycerol acyltransferase domain-containing protein n=1 Tax=Mitosporidium daphniae TaxID=1485682 RepID=A0A098VUC0_9MICR|nr:uncharacterized protein DI09_3p480 [Mitosporidium daphniae]KGG51286.1 hypothetical protein DI09_3p480 [Mitosporidium daphniae]|eukprot:XP_013237713.1 uncharacterized protein DI09_3p480 [Mitosporidium daphniae]